MEFCDAASTVSEAGGAGMIFAMHSANVLSTCLDILGVQVDYAMGTEIYNYIMSTRWGLFANHIIFLDNSWECLTDG